MSYKSFVQTLHGHITVMMGSILFPLLGMYFFATKILGVPSTFSIIIIMTTGIIAIPNLVIATIRHHRPGTNDEGSNKSSKAKGTSGLVGHLLILVALLSCFYGFSKILTFQKYLLGAVFLVIGIASSILYGFRIEPSSAEMTRALLRKRKSEDAEVNETTNESETIGDDRFLKSAHKRVVS